MVALEECSAARADIEGKYQAVRKDADAAVMMARQKLSALISIHANET